MSFIDDLLFGAAGVSGRTRSTSPLDRALAERRSAADTLRFLGDLEASFPDRPSGPVRPAADTAKFQFEQVFDPTTGGARMALVDRETGDILGKSLERAVRILDDAPQQEGTDWNDPLRLDRSLTAPAAAQRQELILDTLGQGTDSFKLPTQNQYLTHGSGPGPSWDVLPAVPPLAAQRARNAAKRNARIAEVRRDYLKGAAVGGLYDNAASTVAMIGDVMQGIAKDGERVWGPPDTVRKADENLEAVKDWESQTDLGAALPGLDPEHQEIIRTLNQADIRFAQRGKRVAREVADKFVRSVYPGDDEFRVLPEEVGVNFPRSKAFDEGRKVGAVIPKFKREAAKFLKNQLPSLADLVGIATEPLRGEMGQRSEDAPPVEQDNRLIDEAVSRSLAQGQLSYSPSRRIVGGRGSDPHVTPPGWPGPIPLADAVKIRAVTKDLYRAVMADGRLPRTQLGFFNAYEPAVRALYRGEYEAIDKSKTLRSAVKFLSEREHILPETRELIGGYIQYRLRR